MTKFLKLIMLFALVANVACSKRTDEQTPMLSAHIETDEPVAVTVYYDIDGDVFVEEITTDSTGRFIFNPELAVDATDITIDYSGKAFGAYLEKGKKVEIEIKGDSATFSGDNLELNKFYNAYRQAFHYAKFKYSPAHPFVFEEAIALLEKGTLTARQHLAEITDNDLREELNRLVDYSNKYYTYKINNLNGTVTNEEMRHLIDSIDPNADAARISGLITYWYGYSDLSRGESPNGYSDTYVEKFQKIDSALTNEGNKKNLYSILANQMLIIFPMNEEEINNFVGKIEPQIKNAPTVRAIFTDAINKLNSQIKDGDELPSNPILVDIDGNKTSLLDCIGGKVAYIDLWATWCAPCCKEIPNMEKVAERFAGNDKIVFISISQDDDVEQWKNKVIADNPSWPNFIFSQPSGKEFLEAINCYSIPRFLIIGSNGRFVAVNAPRPSSENIDSVLNEAIETK